jgi:hypothetical protein
LLTFATSLPCPDDAFCRFWPDVRRKADIVDVA